MRLSPAQVRALTSFLSTNVSHFRPSAFSAAALRRLVQRCPIYTISASQAAEGHFIFVRGVPATCCCLLLHGRVQVRAGNEGLVSDIGPWTMLAVNALLEHNYVADFTARVVSAARVLIIPRAEWLAVRSHPPRAHHHKRALCALAHASVAGQPTTPLLALPGSPQPRRPS